MEDGYKPIEAVMAGNFVYAANEETGEVSVKEVVQTFVNETDELVHLHIGSNELVTTQGHPFFIYGRGFEYAGNLRAGGYPCQRERLKQFRIRIVNNTKNNPVLIDRFDEYIKNYWALY